MPSRLLFKSVRSSTALDWDGCESSEYNRDIVVRPL